VHLTEPSPDPTHIVATSQLPSPLAAAAAAEPKWSSGLFDVLGGEGGLQLALLAACCPCIVYGQTLGQLEPGTTIFAGNVSGAACCFLCTGGLTQCASRPAIRKKYGIGGSFAEDCFTIYLCSCCALIQVRVFVCVGVCL
jgi:Cys-rich protein (TIGR01571 family)